MGIVMQSHSHGIVLKSLLIILFAAAIAASTTEVHVSEASPALDQESYSIEDSTLPHSAIAKRAGDSSNLVIRERIDLVSATSDLLARFPHLEIAYYAGTEFATWLKISIGISLRQRGFWPELNAPVFKSDRNFLVHLFVEEGSKCIIAKFNAFRYGEGLLDYFGALRRSLTLLRRPVNDRSCHWERVMLGVASGEDIMKVLQKYYERDPQKIITAANFFQEYKDALVRAQCDYEHEWVQSNPSSPEGLGYVLTYRVQPF